MARDDIGLVLEHVRKVLAGKDLGRLTDRELLKRFAQERDAEAFAALVQRHGPMVLSVCRRMLRNDHDVEDAFQATFLILVRKAGTHKWDESVGNWLYVVAYRLGLRIRKGAARRFLTGNVAMASTADPLTDVSGRELCLVLDEELCRLPDQYRTPLVLCCLEGLSRDEVARQCGLSLDKLKRRLAKGRLLLRQRLARRGFALSTVLGAALCTERSTASVLPS